MLSSENIKGTSLDKIAQVKLSIQRMYSGHTASCLDNAERKLCKLKRKLCKLNDLNIDNNLVEVFFCNEGKTIDQYAMEVRLNKVKELLVYTSLSVESICQKLHYLSVDEMEFELLQQTGLRISFFHDLKKQKAILVARKASDKI